MSEPYSVGAGPSGYEPVMHAAECAFAGLDYDHGTQDCCPPILRERERRDVARFGVVKLEPDLVNHPAHYKSGGMEAIDVIEAFGLGFCLGNTVKYVLRAGRKQSETTLTELKKAKWYLDREIARLSSQCERELCQHGHVRSCCSAGTRWQIELGRAIHFFDRLRNERVIDALRRKFPGRWKYVTHEFVWRHEDGWEVRAESHHTPRYDGDDDCFEAVYRRSDTGERISLL